MDFWIVVLAVAALVGLNGWWITSLLVSGVVYYSLWEEGIPFDWGFEMGTIIAIPFAWMFAITEIVLTYFK